MTDKGAITQAIEALELLLLDIEWHANSPTHKAVNKSIKSLKAFKDEAPKGVNYGGLSAAIHLQNGIK